MYITLTSRTTYCLNEVPPCNENIVGKGTAEYVLYCEAYLVYLRQGSSPLSPLPVNTSGVTSSRTSSRGELCLLLLTLLLPLPKPPLMRLYILHNFEGNSFNGLTP